MEAEDEVGEEDVAGEEEEEEEEAKDKEDEGQKKGTKENIAVNTFLPSY